MHAPPPAPAKPTILVVDDEPEQCKLLAYILRHDFQVKTAQDSSTALAILNSQHVDVALVDYRMPGMTGTELLGTFRRAQPAGIRFLITAHSENRILQDAINVSQVDKYIQKPVDPEGLRLHILHALAERAAILQEQIGTGPLVDDLAQTLVHDLRNCLQVLSMVPAMLEIGQADAADTSVSMLRQAETSMTDMVEELLLVSKGQTPHYLLKKTAFAPVVHRALEMVAPKIAAAGHRLKLEMPEDLPLLALSVERSTRMLATLVRNAAQAMPTPGVLTVRVYGVGDLLLCAVDDSAPPLSLDEQESLFVPKLAAEPSSQMRPGLALCRAIMQAHGGTLHIETAPEAGNRFVAAFPIASAD